MIKPRPCNIKPQLAGKMRAWRKRRVGPSTSYPLNHAQKRVRRQKYTDETKLAREKEGRRKQRKEKPVNKEGKSIKMEGVSGSRKKEKRHRGKEQTR